MNSRTTGIRLFDVDSRPNGLIQRTLLALSQGALERLLAVDKINAIYGESLRGRSDRPFHDRVLEALEIDIDAREEERIRIPASGPLIVVANHPYGAIEGIAMLSLLCSVRSDVRIVANFMLHRIPQLREHMIFVDPFGTAESRRRNIGGIRQAIEWVKGGGVLAVFPAGEVSHITMAERRVVDPDWSATIGRIIRRTGAPVLPVYFDGRNRALFQIMGLIHPRLRTAMLPRELLRRRGRPLGVTIGNVVPARSLAEFSCDAEMMRYLRERTYFLANRIEARRTPDAAALPPTRSAPLVAGVPGSEIAAEIAVLPDSQMLLEHGDYLVACAGAAQMPHGCREIGRLREEAFRAAGEGTGGGLDLDRFDPHYLHLFVWNRATQEIIGAYRIGRVDRILGLLGVQGLYTATLFRFREGLLNSLGPALELGRSFVAVRHQRNHNALMLLWKGIGA
ncbi:MAG: lysophospholipid acyltransferase family protein, partial [Bacteroidota bacterium]